MKKNKRILLKLSGESLMGEKSFGLDVKVIDHIAYQIKKVSELNIEICMVVGGGNIFRGISGASDGSDRSTLDYMGMLATLINALSLQNALERNNKNNYYEIFESSLPATGLLRVITSLNLTPTVIIFFLIMAMNILGLLGVHSIVSGTILLVLFTGIPTGLSNLVLMQALLVGWGLCTATSIGSLSIVTGATMFELPVMKLITWKNIVYIFVGGTICAIILAIINPFLLS